MRIGEFQFRPRLVPSLLLLLSIPLFVSLGIWQLDRAAEKRELSETLTARGAQQPIDVVAVVDDPEPLRHRRARARGTYDPQDQVYIENRREGARVGFHVVTPLRLEGADLRLLVNRGWVAADAGNEPPAAPAPAGSVEVTGVVDVPSPPAIVLHGGRESARAWGKRWPYLTVDLFQATVDYPVQPFVLLLDPADPTGFTRNWPVEPPKEGMHLGYAIQWLAFAAIALGFYVRLSFIREGARE